MYRVVLFRGSSGPDKCIICTNVSLKARRPGDNTANQKSPPSCWRKSAASTRSTFAGMCNMNANS